jgi:hypothetical protein
MKPMNKKPRMTPKNEKTLGGNGKTPSRILKMPAARAKGETKT